MQDNTSLYKRLKAVVLTVAVLVAATATTSCIKEEHYLTDSSARLQFSEDTVAFDTVFTTMATATQFVKVYNTYDEALMLSSVTLRGGQASRFRINVDGDTSAVARDVEIGAHDSIFIFVQANINPNDQTAPFLVEDAIVFTFNNRQQELPLTAYGRNAVYHHPDRRTYYTYTNSRGLEDTVWFPYSIIDCDHWDHTRPHVIFGYAVVNSNETLHLPAGDELYFGRDAYLWVYDSATLDVHGSQGQHVRFTSIRHDGYYDSLPGQWGYIWLSAGSRDSRIEHALIENGTIGLLVDTNVNERPTVELLNCVVQNMSTAGIVGQGSRIKGDNLLVCNSGGPLLAIQYGGWCAFSSSTFANYWRYDSRKTPSVVLTNYYAYDEATIYPRDLTLASFINCIVYGNYGGQNNSGELLLDGIEGATFNLAFFCCLMRTTLLDSNAHPEMRLILNSDPLFVNPRYGDCHLQEGSPAIGAAEAALVRHPYDLDGHPWAYPPSIGAFEYVPEAEGKKNRNYNNIKNETPCSTTSAAVSTRPHPLTRSSTATAWGTSSKSPSTPIRRLKIGRR